MFVVIGSLNVFGIDNVFLIGNFDVVDIGHFLVGVILMFFGIGNFHVFWYFFGIYNFDVFWYW